MNIEIKVLTVNEAHDFRAIRLSALVQCPSMFGSTYEIELAKPLTFFKECLLNSKVFGVYYEQKIIGLAILTQQSGLKFCHKADLSSVFIEPDYQRIGIATSLLNTVIKHAKHQVQQILLTVADDNQPAVRLYEKFGFQSYGKELKALKDNDQYIDEVLMKLFLF